MTGTRRGSNESINNNNNNNTRQSDASFAFFWRMSLKEKVYLVGSILILALSSSFLKETYDVVVERQRARPDYDYPRFSDLWITFVGIIILSGLRIYLTKTLFARLGEALVNPKYKGEERAERVSRWATVFFKFNFFVIFSYLGYLFLRGKEWVPPSLFGAENGSIENCFTGYPFGEQVPWLREYYLVSLAYHGHSLLFHLLTKRRNDFLEMLLHHVMAVALILFSYFINYGKGGALVIFVHDIADVPGYAVKSATDTKSTLATLITYFSLLAVWGYFRLYVYPFQIIQGFLIHTAKLQDNHGIPFLIGMLCALQMMHILWYALFIQMGLTFFMTGKAEDIQQKIVVNNKNNNNNAVTTTSPVALKSKAKKSN
eukprot:TRINITY_DN9552_c0_g1_i1.p1 TRINITY_DN9552_c0_g1~~TRINITY_DN9552_c0_g1_i1.p1  ORF type:complete len:373 (+),score=68.41 TRINITY_DN9552_c0_g1_i1:136-1254(+)